MSGLPGFLLALVAAIAIVFFVFWRWFGGGIRSWFVEHPVKWWRRDPAAGTAQKLPEPVYPQRAEIQPARRLEVSLAAAALLVYLLTRLIGLEDFPIYFFADEAAQTVLAADLVRDGFRHEGVFLPTYFYNVDKYSLGTTVYLQLIPYLLFGKSILVTRTTAVLTAGLGALAVWLILRVVFRYPHAWAAVLLLGLSPAWFIHSRTAFEAAQAAAFFGVFLYAYLRYIHGAAGYIPVAAGAAALAFYSYNPARVVILAALLLLIVFDFRTHWANRRDLVRCGWLVLLAVPYLRFQAAHPFSEVDHLYLLNSYWIQPLTFPEKIGRFFQEYVRGLSPLYWYQPHDLDLVRHVMRGYGHMLWSTLPLALLGLVEVAGRMRQPAYRGVLVALFCAPLGGALVQTFVTRSLFVVIPVTLLSALGLARVHGWLAERLGLSRVLAIGLFGLLAGGNFFLLRAALVEGPTWHRDYGLYGMQYGAAQVFGVVEEWSAADPDLEFVVSPRWTHGLSMLVRFFLDDPVPVVWGVVDDYLELDYPLDEASVYVMLPDEYERARADPRLAEVRVEQIVRYPDGEPGFYFARLRIAN